MKPTSIAALMGGAIAGVAAMYLLDPDQGERRRRAIASKAGTYWDETSDAVAGAVAQPVGPREGRRASRVQRGAVLRERPDPGHMKHVAGDVHGHVDDAHAQAASQAQSWLDQGRKWLSGYRDQAMSYRDQAMKNAPQSAAEVQALAQGYGQAAWDRARKIGWRAHDRAVDAVNRGRTAIGPKQVSPIVPVALTAASFLALGAGAM